MVSEHTDMASQLMSEAADKLTEVWQELDQARQEADELRKALADEQRLSGALVEALEHMVASARANAVPGSAYIADAEAALSAVED
jgi:hypothetical protein